ncbi:MAG TPA: ABC transporter ATP-binding protein [Polyangia bacterium]|jgi:ABC-2 type transport system ATP-binding protein
MISVDDVSLSYDGVRDAVGALSFAVAPGSIFALVGPNGAGKTSTLRMLATLQRPSGGAIRIDGIDAARDAEGVRRRVGYLPDNFALYDAMTPVDYLDFFGRCYEVDDTTRKKRIDALLEEFDLSQKRAAPIRALSRGMRQRLGVAKTLMHAPKVLLLDEPASALDPGARMKLREALLRQKARGLSIIISSHILPDLAGLADAVGIMEGGRMIRAGAIDAIAADARATYVVEVRGNVDKAARVFADFGPRLHATREVSPGRFELELDGGADAVASLVEALVLRGARLSHVAPRESAIEAVYRKSAATEVA